MQFQSPGVHGILVERQRQIWAEDYHPDHDDTHTKGELAFAAGAYLNYAMDQIDYQTHGRLGNPPSTFAFTSPGWIGATGQSRPHTRRTHPVWPWRESGFRPSPNLTNQDIVRNLEKAGALIAAEIDRLVRLDNRQNFAMDPGPMTPARPPLADDSHVMPPRKIVSSKRVKDNPQA